MPGFISPSPDKPKNDWHNVIGSLLRAINVPVPWDPIPPYKSPYPEYIPAPTPTPTLAPTQYWRNPNMDKWANNSPRYKIDEIKSALDLAAQKYPDVTKSLLGDMSGLESQWRNFKSPVGAVGPFQFMPATARAGGLMDSMDATKAAELAAKMVSQGRLGEWDITDMPGAGGNSLTDFYTKEELDKYSRNSNKRRVMLRELAGR
jgi:hypothetical protein